VSQGKAHHLLFEELTTEQIALPFGRQVAAIDYLAAAVTLIAHAQGLVQRWLCGKAERVLDRVDAVDPGHGDERLTPAIERMSPRVRPCDRHVVDVQPQLARAKTPHAAACQRAGSVNGLDVALVVQTLVEEQVSTRSPAKRVQIVVRVLGAEPTQ